MTQKKLPKTHAQILASIPVGADSHLITGKELAERYGMSLRGIQTIIGRLIIEYGVPICASRDISGGYYIPANDTERLEGIKSLRSQLTKEMKRVDALMIADLEAWRDYLNG